MARVLPERLASGNAEDLPQSRLKRATAVGVGPRAALKKAALQNMSRGERKMWIEEARLDALLGNRTATLKALRSGVCCYMTFAGTAGKQARRGRCFGVAAVIRSVHSWVEEILPTESRHPAVMVDLVQIQRHMEQLPQLCEDSMHDSSCASRGKIQAGRGAALQSVAHALPGLCPPCP